MEEKKISDKKEVENDFIEISPEKKQTVLLLPSYTKSYSQTRIESIIFEFTWEIDQFRNLFKCIDTLCSPSFPETAEYKIQMNILRKKDSQSIERETAQFYLLATKAFTGLCSTTIKVLPRENILSSNSISCRTSNSILLIEINENDYYQNQCYQNHVSGFHSDSPAFGGLSASSYVQTPENSRIESINKFGVSNITEFGRNNWTAGQALFKSDYPGKNRKPGNTDQNTSRNQYESHNQYKSCTNTDRLKIDCKFEIFYEVTSNTTHMNLQPSSTVFLKDIRSLGDSTLDESDNELEDEKSINFIVGDEKYVISKKLLHATNSRYFKNIYLIHGKEKDMTKELTASELPAFKEMLVFILTGSIQSKDDYQKLKELLTTADKYDVPNLKLTCEHYLLRKIAVYNAVRLIELAFKHNAEFLKINSASFIKFHFKEVVNTDEFKKLPQENSNKILELIEKCKVPEISTDQFLSPAYKA